MDTHPLTDPRLDDIPVEECGEPLVDVGGVAALAVEPRPRGLAGPSTWLRGTVVDRLVIAQSLLPRGLRLLILEGHRSADRVPADGDRRCGPSGTAPHLTGAAADLTMCDARGVGLDLGSAVPADRRILGTALSGAGLVNLPGTWWHWSFGDPYWALVSGARAAIYGPVEPTSTKD